MVYLCFLLCLMAGISNKTDHNICHDAMLVKQSPPLLEDEKVVTFPLDELADNAGKGAVTPSFKRQVMVSSVGDVLEITKVTLIVPAGADQLPCPPTNGIGWIVYAPPVVLCVIAESCALPELVNVYTMSLENLGLVMF